MLKQNSKSNLPIFLILGIIMVAMVLSLVLIQLNSNTATPATTSSATEAATTSSLVGQALPAITLLDNDGKTYSLEQLEGKTVVLFFSEGLRCYPACWNQIAEFGKDSRFNSDTVVALSVIPDSQEDWQQAIDQMSALKQAQTVFDPNAAAARTLGLLTLSSAMHKGALPGHTYVILDKIRVVRYVYDDASMSINNDNIYNKLLEFN